MLGPLVLHPAPVAREDSATLPSATSNELGRWKIIFFLILPGAIEKQGFASGPFTDLDTDPGSKHIAKIM